MELCERPSGQGYKGSSFNQILYQQLVQGGFYQGQSIYGSNFEDENFDLKHSRPGVVSMANAGPNSNGVEFFIITQQDSSLDGKHVVFGQVLKGLSVIYNIEKQKVKDFSFEPWVNITITDCREEKMEKPVIIRDHKNVFSKRFKKEWIIF